MTSSLGWQIFGLLLIIIAFMVANRSKVASPARAVDYLGGFFIVFGAILFALLFGLPKLMVITPNVARNNYAPILSGTGRNVQQAFNTATDYIASSSVPLSSTPAPEPTVPPLLVAPQPQPTTVSQETLVIGSTTYTIQPGDRLLAIASEYDVSVDEIVALNPGLNPDRIKVGEEIEIPTQQVVVVTVAPVVVEQAPEQSSPVPTPTASPVPVDLEDAFASLANYKRDGDITAALSVLDAIDRVSPDNQNAAAIRTEIEAASSLKGSWATLGRKVEDDPDKFYYNEVQRPFVYQLLGGYDFEIIEYEEKFGSSANYETMRIRCVSPGWLVGTEFTLQAGHITPFGYENVGDVVTIPTGG